MTLPSRFTFTFFILACSMLTHLLGAFDIRAVGASVGILTDTLRIALHIQATLAMLVTTTVIPR